MEETREDKMINLSKRIIKAIMGICLLLSAGCSAPAPQKAREVVAKINDYQLTTDDFNHEKTPLLPYLQIEQDKGRMKEIILDELINRQILLQEAQRQGLDKERPFMKEIENYWKQALLTSLLKKKSEELSADTQVLDEELNRQLIYARRKLLARIMVLADEDSAKQLSAAGEDFAAIREGLNRAIISESGEEWFEAQDLNSRLRHLLFSLEKGKISQPLKENGYWIVARVSDEEAKETGQEESLKEQLKGQLKEEKVGQKMAAWMEELRQKAEVEINPQVLNEIELLPRDSEGGK